MPHRLARRLLLVLFAGIPLAPILAGALMGDARAPAAPRRGLVLTPSAGAGAAAGPTSAVVVPGSGTLVAHLTRPVTARLSPAGRELGPIGLHTHFGSPTWLSVVRTSGAWLGVLTPLAGNGRLAWIPADAVSLSRSPWLIRISLSGRRVEVADGGRILRRWRVAVGRPSAPTPTGHFAVTDRLITGDETGPYGCCILALSARSPHPIEGWSGGNRVAIHATPETASIGEAASHGCVRVTSEAARWLMAHIPLATPVVIRA